jgi:hypothetical protein
MNAKPGDLLLSVIEFFGILVPGTAFALLHGDRLLSPFGVSLHAPGSATDWIPTFLVAYVLGHFLLGFSVWFNKVAAKGLSTVTRQYFEAVQEQVVLPAGAKRSPEAVFYSAYSFIRLSSPAALAEVERQAGEYKLFRSLTLLVLLDVPLSWSFGLLSTSRLAADLVITALAFYRFQWLYDWTHQLVFDFFLQLHAPPSSSPPPRPAGGKN